MGWKKQLDLSTFRYITLYATFRLTIVGAGELPESVDSAMIIFLIQDMRERENAVT